MKYVAKNNNTNKKKHVSTLYGPKTSLHILHTTQIIIKHFVDVFFNRQAGTWSKDIFIRHHELNPWLNYMFKTVFLPASAGFFS